MIASFIFAVAFRTIDHGMPWWMELILSVGLTTVVWLVVTFMTPATDESVLKSFYQKVHPAGNGWNPIRKLLGDSSPPNESIAPQIGSMLMGTISVYGFLFGIGKIIYGSTLTGLILLLIAAALGYKIISTHSAKQAA
jgi:hypothetical protein